MHVVQKFGGLKLEIKTPPFPAATFALSTFGLWRFYFCLPA